MSLLKHYIMEVIKETKRKTQYGIDIVEVKMVVNCYGVIEQTTHIFSPTEWKQAKAKGYYMA